MQVLVKAFLFMGEHIYKHQTCVNDVNIGSTKTLISVGHHTLYSKIMQWKQTEKSLLDTVVMPS